MHDIILDTKLRYGKISTDNKILIKNLRKERVGC